MHGGFPTPCSGNWPIDMLNYTEFSTADETKLIV
jgi:hypothetical protein